MRIRRLLSVVIFVIMLPAFGQTTSQDYVGEWLGNNKGVPWVILDVKVGSGGLGGKATFYILDTSPSAVSPKVLGKEDVEIIDATLEANEMSFKVKNDQGDVVMNSSSGRELTFHLTMKSKAEGELRSDDPKGPTVTMTRAK